MTDQLPRNIDSGRLGYQDYSFLDQAASRSVLEEFHEAACTFVGPMFILLPKHYRHPQMPHLHIDLSQIGMARGGQYRVYHEGNRFLYSNDRRYFGECPRDQRLVAASPHGTRLFVQYFDGRSQNRALIWICKRRDYPTLTTSLHFRKSPETKLHLPRSEQPLTRSQDLMKPKVAQLNEVRSLQGQVTSRSRSRVRVGLEPLFQPAISLTSQRRSQVTAAGAQMNTGQLTLTAKRSTVRAQGCSLVIGQLRSRLGKSSTLESHFRVRPREENAATETYTYGAFGHALIQHRDRYWFSFDPQI